VAGLQTSYGGEEMAEFKITFTNGTEVVSFCKYLVSRGVLAENDLTAQRLMGANKKRLEMSASGVQYTTNHATGNWAIPYAAKLAAQHKAEYTAWRVTQRLKGSK